MLLTENGLQWNIHYDLCMCHYNTISTIADDYSRVVLSDSDGSDYVNAAFLDVSYFKKLTYNGLPLEY